MRVQVFSQPAGLQNNAYVLVEGRKALVIDPSFMVDEIEEMLVSEDLNLVGVLLTHAHFDHMGEGQGLAARHHALVHVSKLDQPLFGCGLLSKWRKYDAGESMRFFDQLDELGGFDFKVVPMPGHSPGSVGYYVAPYFFTGDSVLQVNLGPDNLPFSDPAAFDQTVRDFMDLPDHWIIMPGHYGYGQTLGQVKKENPELLARLQKLES